MCKRANVRVHGPAQSQAGSRGPFELESLSSGEPKKAPLPTWGSWSRPRAGTSQELSRAVPSRLQGCQERQEQEPRREKWRRATKGPKKRSKLVNIISMRAHPCLSSLVISYEAPENVFWKQFLNHGLGDINVSKKALPC